MDPSVRLSVGCGPGLPTVTRPAPVLLLAAVVWSWVRLAWALTPHWSSGSHYAYGWGMPALSVYLLARSWRGSSSSVARKPLQAPTLWVLLVLSATLLPPFRLIYEANPGWRLAAWAWTLQNSVLSLAALGLARGPGRVRQAVFPILFFTLAVPWPSPFESAVLRQLTAAVTASTVALLHAFGVPALPHGNLIETAAGTVGVDEACSGIRSVQAGLMVALFFGEFYRLNVLARWGCVAGSVVLALLGNIGRATALTLLAGYGAQHAAGWHEPLGLAIPSLTLLASWLLARRLRSPFAGDQPDAAQPIEEPSPKLAAPRRQYVPSGRVRAVGLALLLWLVLLEVAVPAWFQYRERRQPFLPAWTVTPPTQDFTFRPLPIPERTTRLLHYDEGTHFSFTDLESGRWEILFLRWRPGPEAVIPAGIHTPEICLPATGAELTPLGAFDYFASPTLCLPFQGYRFRRGIQHGYVFLCRLGDRGDHQLAQPGAPPWRSRLSAVVEGRPTQGLRILQLAVQGPSTPAQARQALAETLRLLLRCSAPPDPQSQ